MSETEFEIESVDMAEPPRHRRSAEERLRVVEEALVPGTSVARVARKYGINANQVFQWRRLYREGRLGGERGDEMRLLPVTVSEDVELTRNGRHRAASPATIRIEMPNQAQVRVEGDVDPRLIRAVIESLRR